MFAIIKKNEIKIMLENLNKIHSRDEFTYEMEVARRINFLDMTILRMKEGLTTMRYKKECSSDRILNYVSNHPYNYKIIVLYILVNRSVRLQVECLSIKLRLWSLLLAKKIVILLTYIKIWVNWYNKINIDSKTLNKDNGKNESIRKVRNDGKHNVGLYKYFKVVQNPNIDNNEGEVVNKTCENNIVNKLVIIQELHISEVSQKKYK